MATYKSGKPSVLIDRLESIDAIGDLDGARSEEALRAALDQFGSNPVIDEEVRKNKVIMRELSKAISRAFNPLFEEDPGK